MNRLLSYTSGFLKTRNSWILYIPKCLIVELKNSKNEFLCCDIETNRNKYLLNKIYFAQDEATKQNIRKIMLKINLKYHLEPSNILCLVKSKSKINEMSIIKIIKPNSDIEVEKELNTNENQMMTKFTQLRDSPRTKRREAGEVICGFIPKEWATFFVPITGFTGFYTLVVTLGTFLFSKEIYVCDHEYYNGISMVILCIYVVKKYGPILAKDIDKEIDNYERNLINWNEKMKLLLRNAIISEIKNQECMEGQQLLIRAKRENIDLQREAEFRKRQMEVYDNVTRILDYHVECGKVERIIQHKNLIQWVTNEVEKSLTPELKEQYMKVCMADIKEIFRKNKK